MRTLLAFVAAALFISSTAMAQSSTELSNYDNPNAVRGSGIGPSDGPLGITGSSSDPNAGYNVTVTTIEGGRVVSHETSSSKTVPTMQYLPSGGR